MQKSCLLRERLVTTVPLQIAFLCAIIRKNAESVSIMKAVPRRVVTVDGGTTNTRLVLWEDDRILAVKKLAAGASDTLRTGSAKTLETAVRDGLAAILSENGLASSDIAAVAASGMIGSEIGLYAVPHLPLPAGPAKIVKACRTASLPSVFPVPITFIPGLKKAGETYADTDLVRGEETEALGLAARGLPDGGLLCLPGTHNKIIRVEKGGVITDFATAMSGDVIRALAEHTILAASLTDGYTKTPDLSLVEEGYDLCDALGLTASLFKLRVAHTAFHAEPTALYARLVGMVLHEDVRRAAAFAAAGEVLVAGSEPFRSSLTALLSRHSALRAVAVPDKTADLAAAFGAKILLDAT